MSFNMFVTPRDSGGNPIWLRPAPLYTDQRTLAAAGTAETLAVPAAAGLDLADVVVFAWSVGNIQVKPIAAGTVSPPTVAPTGDIADGSAWELNPTGYQIQRQFAPGASAVAVGSFQIQADTAGCIVSASFYTLRRNGT